MALSNFLVSLLTIIGIYALFGLGLNVKYGFTGLVDFGHVLYFMIGAYATVVLGLSATGASGYQGLGGFAIPQTLAAVPGGGFVGWLVAVAVAMGIAAVLSLLVGVPTLRLREDYLAIMALGIATIFHSVVNNERWLFNGSFGIREVYQPFVGVFPLTTGSFALNLVAFGVPSVLALGYLGLRLVRYLRPMEFETALSVTAGVVGLALGLGVATLGGPALVGGLALVVGGLLVLRRGVRRADGLSRPLTLATTELFVLWYFVFPLATSGVRGVVFDVVWLLDPTAGPTGGLDYGRFLLALTLLFVAGAYWWTERTVNSPYGRVLRSIREDEDVPRALGKPTFRYKAQSLMFGSALAAAAGGLWATHITFVDPTQFTATITFFAFTAVIIGGTANNRGVLLGSVVFWTLHTGTRFLDDFFPTKYSVQLAAIRLILIGSLLILILYYRPEGLLGEQSYDTGVGANGGEHE